MTYRIHLIIALFLPLLGFFGCDKPEVRNPEAPPPPTYRGPEFLHTSIGSMCSLRGYQPMLVSGYGLVVGLNGTGSGDCPPALRSWLLGEMSRQGFGTLSHGMQHLQPSQVMASDQTAVVIVRGVMPPGSVKGTRFDLLVDSLPATQTTSLEGGRLYTTTLHVGPPANPGRAATHPAAKGRGPLFLNPFVAADGVEDAATSLSASPYSNPRTARILGGGYSTVDLPLHLVLNRPSYRLAAEIADRINARFPQGVGDAGPMAIAKSDAIIELRVLQAYRSKPQHMLDLISHLFLNPTIQFAQFKGHEMLKFLEDPKNKRFSRDVAYAWEGMGKSVISVIKSAYGHSRPSVALAALRAGSNLKDVNTVQPLEDLIVTANDPKVVQECVEILGSLLLQYRGHPRISQTLRKMLEHEDALVRMATYHALAKAGEPVIRRIVYPNKFAMDLVPSDKPMIYVTQQGPPHLVLFDSQIQFRFPVLLGLWNNRFMLMGEKPDAPLRVRYRNDRTRASATHEVAPYLANLVHAMSSKELGGEVTQDGFDLGYSEVVSAVYAMSKRGVIDAPFMLQPSDLVQRVSRSERMATTGPRDETANQTEQWLSLPESERGESPEPTLPPATPTRPESEPVPTPTPIERPQPTGDGKGEVIDLF